MKISKATPTTSFLVSPIVSPVTAALCAALPLPWPSKAPDSMYFFALSNDPPELPMKIARGIATTVAPSKIPTTNSGPNKAPQINGTASAIIDGSNIRLKADLVASLTSSL